MMPNAIALPRQDGMIRFAHAALISRMNRVMPDFNQFEGHLRR